LPWVLIGGFAAVGLWTCLNYKLVFYETSIFLLFTVQILLKIWFAGETCHRWIEDRRSGALELLLCAPLGTRDLVRGQGMALRRQFGWPIAVTLALTLGAWFVIKWQWGNGSNTETGRTWLLMSIPALLADLVALRWVGAWLGLTARGLNRAIAGTLARVLWLRWILYFLCLGVANTWEWIGFGQLRLLQQDVFWLCLAVTLDLTLGWFARRKFLRYFRTIAANPLDYETTFRRITTLVTARAVSTPSSGDTRLAFGLPKRVLKRASLLVSLLVLVVGVPAGYLYWLRLSVQHRIRAAEQAGLPVTVEELDRRRPPLTNTVNAADVLERASYGLLRPYQVALAPAQQLLGDFQNFSPDRAQPLTPQMKVAIASFLSSNQTALAILHAAPSLRAGRYMINWKSGGRRIGIDLHIGRRIRGRGGSFGRLIDQNHSRDFIHAFDASTLSYSCAWRFFELL
jgi:hypothetical protein